MRARILSVAVLALGAVLVLRDAAGSEEVDLPVHDGMTAADLKTFAEKQGWKAEVSTSGLSVTLEVDGQRIHFEMLRCDKDAACTAGIIRDTSYLSVGPQCDFWHWNQEGHGATGYGASYVTLERYVQFRGVTDRYLADVVKAWLAAAPSFWKRAHDCAASKPLSPAP